MAVLNIYQDKNLIKKTCDQGDIQSELKELGISFENWQLDEELTTKTSLESIKDIFSEKISKVLTENNFSSYDIVSVKPDHQGLDELKQKFIPEHIHDDNEVRFFIDGEGLFCINKNEKIYQILCQKGDYISVPSETKHWFDMGSKADFKCIRFFEDEAGWIAKYTGSEISTQYPLFDEFTKNN